MLPIESKNMEEYITIGNARFYPNRSQIEKEGTVYGMSGIEASILRTLAATPNVVVTYEHLSLEVFSWEFHPGDTAQFLTRIRRLRQKLGAEHLITIPDVGYKLVLTVVGAPGIASIGTIHT